MLGGKNRAGLFFLFAISSLASVSALAQPSISPSSVETNPAEEASSDSNAPAELTQEIQSHLSEKNILEALPPKLSTSEDGRVQIHKDKHGYVLHVDGSPYFLQGINWTYIPIGKNYSYNLWAEPDWVIKAALEKEMGLLRDMGVNTIRQYTGVPAKWIAYIYHTYGITTVLNHPVGRYGMEIDGSWVAVTNYQDPRTRELLKADIRKMIEEYKDCDGIIFWLLGNENNYGLHWSSFEIEQLPEDEQYQAKATHLYSLFGEIVDEIHALDNKHPVGIANGDLQYIDIIAEQIPNLDIFGSNVYRGVSVRDLYEKVEEKLKVPVFFSEFGADAYNAREQKEAHLEQAYFLREQWKEIYLNTYSRGTGNSIGGYTFQWSDGWWKYLQEENLDVQDNNASWPNGGYFFDYVEGENNMNEEWFGICAKGWPDENNLFDLYPRASYYLLQDAYRLPVYKAGVSEKDIEAHFSSLRPSDYDLEYQAQLGLAQSKEHAKSRLQDIRSHFYTFAADRGDGRRIEHMESFFLDFVAEPTSNIKGDISVNILGNVPENRIDELFYEARGKAVRITDNENQEVLLQDLNRVQVYQASVEWKAKQLDMTTYFRKGHYHWAHEGDFFNFYREAHYGPNPDIYNAAVPIGAELEGKNSLSGWKLAIGPQIYWGANPTAIAKYHKRLGSWDIALLHQEDVSNQGAVTTLNVIPEQPLRRSSFYVAKQLGALKAELGLLFSGANKSGRAFQYITNDGNYGVSNYAVVDDEIYWLDALGTKLRVTKDSGRIMFYGQGGYQGIVADAGSEQDIRFTGWTTRSPGRGNHWHTMGGLAFSLGNFQLAPHLLMQKPLVGPMPSLDAAISPSGLFTPALQPRSVLSAPFMVIENREMTAVELLLAYDQTPGTWMWHWDNDIKEDAQFSGFLNFVYRKQPTSRDATLGFDEYGNLFAFSDAPDAADLWEIKSRIILTSSGGSRLILNTDIGTGQSTGAESRVVDFYRFQVRGWHKKLHSDLQFKVNDWGPFDYHRVYNLTFPFQAITKFEVGMTKPRYGQSYPNIGILGKYRLADENSPANIPLNILPNGWGHQYEVGAYVSFGR